MRGHARTAAFTCCSGRHGGLNRHVHRAGASARRPQHQEPRHRHHHPSQFGGTRPTTDEPKSTVRVAAFAAYHPAHVIPPIPQALGSDTHRVLRWGEIRTVQQAARHGDTTKDNWSRSSPQPPPRTALHIVLAVAGVCGHPLLKLCCLIRCARSPFCENEREPGRALTFCGSGRRSATHADRRRASASSGDVRQSLDDGVLTLLGGHRAVPGSSRHGLPLSWMTRAMCDAALSADRDPVGRVGPGSGPTRSRAGDPDPVQPQSSNAVISPGRASSSRRLALGPRAYRVAGDIS